MADHIVVGVSGSHDGSIEHSSVATPTEFMLSTIDNPHSPFDEFDLWYATDQRLGYNTPTLLARVAYTSNDLSDLDQDQAINQAIDDILNAGINPNYRKVTREDYKK